jgi:hypothetical protein
MQRLVGLHQVQLRRAGDSSGGGGGGGSVTVPLNVALTAGQSQTWTLTDAATTTAPDIFGLRHVTTSTAAAGFGLTTWMDLQNAAGTMRRAMTDVTAWTSPADTAEASSRTIQTMKAGVLTPAVVLGFTSDYSGLNLPNLGSVAAPSITIGTAASKAGFFHSGGQIAFAAAGVQGGTMGSVGIVMTVLGSAGAPSVSFGGAGFYTIPFGVGMAAGSANMMNLTINATPFVFTAPVSLAGNNTASTEAVAFDHNMSRTSTWATGNFATQREVLIRPPTYAFVGASTITNAATLAISGAPIAGANATITNSYAFWTQNGLVRNDLADAATTTAPEIYSLRHTTSGTAGIGFGLLSAVDLQSGGGTVRRAATDVTAWTTATNAAEVSSRTFALMVSGALTDSFVFATGNFTIISGGARVSIGQYGEVAIARNVATGSCDLTGSAFGIAALNRFSENKGADVASASSLSVGLGGNYFHVTGSTAIDFLATAAWQDGGRCDLYFVAACTVNNNTGAPPGGTHPFALSGSVNYAATAGSRLSVRRDAALGKWVEIARTPG